MRLPKYLSPSSISLWQRDRREFYLKYLADSRAPRMPQTKPMSIGSAFDARVKSYLHKKINGTVDPKFDFENLFREQVDEPNREWARPNSEYVFNSYRYSGALADIVLELNTAVESHFELQVDGVVKREGEFDGVPILGYPDVYFKLPSGCFVVYDWKVNGYCAARKKSPERYYVDARDGWDHTFKPSRNTGIHKDAQALRTTDGIIINVAQPFEQACELWAQQITIYGWLLGVPVGAKMIAGIEQLIRASNDEPANGFPLIKVASFRGYVSYDYQIALITEIHHLWKTINSGHIFEEMSPAENDAECKRLDRHYANYDASDPKDQWFDKITRGY